MNIAFTTEFPKDGFTKLAAHHLHCMLEEADILISAFNTPVRRDMIERMPHLRLIANFGVGFDNIDIAACREKGIVVTNTPHSVIEATAELCWSLVQALVRRTAELDRHVRENRTAPSGLMSNLSHSLYGMHLGIIGMGHIGQAVARRALACGMRVCYYNRTPIDKNSPRWQVKYSMPNITYRMHQMLFDEVSYVPLNDLLKEVDIVSLNLPYTPNVFHLIDEEQLSMMKPSSYLINTSRGAIVNQTALIHALQNNQIRGAAMDVFENEPEIDERLKKLDNVVLSPHVGTATFETRMSMCEEIVHNVLNFINGHPEEMSIVSQ